MLRLNPYKHIFKARRVLVNGFKYAFRRKVFNYRVYNFVIIQPHIAASGEYMALHPKALKKHSESIASAEEVRK